MSVKIETVSPRKSVSDLLLTLSAISIIIKTSYQEHGKITFEAIGSAIPHLASLVSAFGNFDEIVKEIKGLDRESAKSLSPVLIDFIFDVKEMIDSIGS